MNEMIRLPLGDWVSDGVDWVVANASAFFGVLRSIFLGAYDGVNWVLATPPAFVIIGAIVVLGLLARGWLFALLSGVGLVLIMAVDQWDNAMDTFALVLVAATIAILLAVPLGIAAAKVQWVSMVVRPFMDFLQTMPAFVYLIPALLLFRVGVAPGIVATILFAMPPGVRLTELGIRGVNRETVEAGQAFGATPGRILRQINCLLLCRPLWPGLTRSSCCLCRWL